MNASVEPSPRLESGWKAIDIIRFRQAILDWGRIHRRIFPWRRTRDPYRILIAEVMLHRTQAAQVGPVYQAFVTRYPDARALGSASKGDLRRDLYPLGLLWRIDLVREMARELVVRYEGKVPRERSDLLSLRGVSDYVASAVRCFAWNLPDPLVDTNTVRITGRLFGLETKESSRRSRLFRQLLGAMVDPVKPREYNYALLDLGAEVCLARRPPECSRCPVVEFCDYPERPRS